MSAACMLRVKCELKVTGLEESPICTSIQACMFILARCPVCFVGSILQVTKMTVTA